MTPPTPDAVVLMVGLGVASYTDIKTGKIPNILTAGMMLAGVIMHAISGQATFALVGLGAAFAIHFPLWLLKVERGGDAKLLMGLGALVGWIEMVESSLWYAVIYAPSGLILLAISGRLGNLWKTLQWMAKRASGGAPVEPPEPTKLKTAPIIAVAGTLALIGDWLLWVIV